MFGVTELLMPLILMSGFQLAVCSAEQAAAPSSQTQPQTPPPRPANPISGYMDFHLNKPVDDPAPAVIDFHRFVLLFTHQFSDRVRFVGELELEHAVVE